MEVVLMDGESRQNYLLRVAMHFLREHPVAAEHTIVFDEAECDGNCLADDIQIVLEGKGYCFD